MKQILKPFLIILVFLSITNCNNDDNTVVKKIEEAIPEVIEKGIFLDSPVQGLTYTTDSKTGQTDADGTFEYIEGETVVFKVGSTLLGETMGKEVVTPLDLVAGGTLGNQQVRNIASLLQSLDSDADVTNGILIDDETIAAIASDTIDFSSDDFSVTLRAIVDRINEAKTIPLGYVGSNTAVQHLAESLNLQSEFETLPRVLEGREWEEGEYFVYNTTPSDEYLFKIGSDLTGVRYHLGGDFGMYMDMTYEKGKLSGFGNFYSGLNENPPVQPSAAFEYRNRVMSPGYVMDYGGETFLGYYNYFKTSGDLGKIQGTYEAFFYYDQKRVNEDPEIQFVFKNELVLSEPEDVNERNNYFLGVLRAYDISDTIISETPFIISKENLDNEDLLLVRFQETDYIFIKLETSIGVSPGLLAVKKK